MHSGEKLCSGAYCHRWINMFCCGVKDHESEVELLPGAVWSKSCDPYTIKTKYVSHACYWYQFVWPNHIEARRGWRKRITRCNFSMLLRQALPGWLKSIYCRWNCRIVETVHVSPCSYWITHTIHICTSSHILPVKLQKRETVLKKVLSPLWPIEMESCWTGRIIILKIQEIKCTMKSHVHFCLPLKTHWIVMAISKRPKQGKTALGLNLLLLYVETNGQYPSFTDISRKAPIDLCRAWILPNESNSALGPICL